MRDALKQRRRPGATAPHGGLSATISAAARRGGRPLDSATRGALETSFGHDLGQVRIHADAEAHRLAQEVDAAAFTVGQDVFFRSGAYEPGSPAGMYLLAHEATHTIQQHGVDAGALDVGRGDGPARSTYATAGPDLTIAERSSAIEGEARVAGVHAAAGLAASAATGSEAAVARDGDFLSGISDIFAIPNAATGLLPGFDPISQAIGTVGNIQKALTADDTLGVVSGVSGAIGNQLGLINSLGADTLSQGASSVLGGLVGGANAVQGFTDMVSDWGQGEYFKAIAGDATKGIGGTLSGLASLGGFSLLGEGGMLGAMGAISEGGLGVLGTVGGIEGSALTMSAGGALAGEGLSGLAALGPAGAVIGSFAGGVAAGIGLDNLVDYIGDEVTGNEQADHSISGGLADVMTSVDQAGVGALRSLGVLDESAPEYTQTLGWQLAEILPSWMQ